MGSLSQWRAIGEKGRTSWATMSHQKKWLDCWREGGWFVVGHAEFQLENFWSRLGSLGRQTIGNLGEGGLE